MGPIATVRQLEAAPPKHQDVHSSPVLRQCIDQPLAECTDQPLPAGHGLQSDMPESAHRTDISEQQPMRWTGGTAAEAPDCALVSLPVAHDILARADGTPGQQLPVPECRFRLDLHDGAQRPDPGSIEVRRPRQKMLQLSVFLPVERGEPRNMNCGPVPKPRQEVRWRQIVSGGDAPDP
jgi:hypothetical protein